MYAPAAVPYVLTPVYSSSSSFLLFLHSSSSVSLQVPCIMDKFRSATSFCSYSRSNFQQPLPRAG